MMMMMTNDNLLSVRKLGKLMKLDYTGQNMKIAAAAVYKVVYCIVH